MNLNKTNIFGSINTPIGIIGILEKNKRILSVHWTDKIIKPTSPMLIETLDKVKNYFSNKIGFYSIPIDLKKTKLQIKILKTIMDIPFGNFYTYGSLAKKLNIHPRVVGHACSINPLPLIIPCHRVLRSDKKLGGYSYGNGIETKRWLLNHENIKL